MIVRNKYTRKRDTTHINMWFKQQGFALHLTIKLFSLQKVITAFFSLLVSYGCMAQYALVFSRLSMSEGLTTNKINCVWQDGKGFLWIGHENGLQRFDGRKFIHFKTANPSQLIPASPVDQILDAGNNQLWIRQGTMIGLFDRNNFTYRKIATPEGLTGNLRYQLYIDSEKNTFLLTGTPHIFSFDHQHQKFTVASLPFTKPANWPVTQLLEDKEKKQYWLSGDSGLIRYDRQQMIYRGTGKDPLFSIPYLQQISYFFISADRHYWIAYRRPNEAGSRLMHYDPTRNLMITDTLLNNHISNKSGNISQIVQTANGDTWIAGNGNLVSYTPKNKLFYQHMLTSPYGYGLDCKAVYHLYEDREKNYWLSTDNGLFMTGPGKSGISNLVFPSNTLVTALQAINNNEIWIGTSDKSITYFDSNYRQIIKPIQYKNDLKHLYRYTGSLLQQRATGHIWATFTQSAIAIIAPLSKNLIYQSPAPAIFKNENTHHTVEDPSGNIWFGTDGGQLIRWKAGSNYQPEAFTTVQDFPSAITGLLADNRQQLWLTTDHHGVYIVHAQSGKIIHHFQHTGETGSLGSNRTADIIQYNDSIFLVASDGLAIINSNTKTVINKNSYAGLPGTRVYQVSIDKKGTIWLITNNGLCSYQFNKNQFTSYNQHDGIVNADEAINTRLVLNNGTLLLGGSNILLSIDPEVLKPVIAPPAVTITDFRLSDKFLPVDSLLQLKRINLQHNEHSFSIYFSTLSFLQQDKLTYYYMLEGIDQDWQYGDRNVQVNYTALAPGHYTFKVRCENLQGISSPVTSLAIYIKPPFYKTGWFLVLLLALVITGIYSVYRLRIKRLLALEKLRTRVARDLHDDMGSTLSTINILSAMAGKKINTDTQQTSEYIQKISENSQQMMEVMDDIVWTIKPDNDSMQKITGRMREFATSLLEAKGIELDFTVEDMIKNIRLDMEARRDLFLLFKEAVNNIAKYADCTHVQISITGSSKQLILSIKDNGIGFSPADTDTGNGLGNMRKRADALKGTLQIESAPLQGTYIRLHIPLE